MLAMALRTERDRRQMIEYQKNVPVECSSALKREFLTTGTDSSHAGTAREHRALSSVLAYLHQGGKYMTRAGIPI